MRDRSRWLLCAGVAAFVTSVGYADPPPDIEASLVKIGPIVDPVCTAKLYRPLMPKNDITSGVAQPYPGITVTRNQSFARPLDDIAVIADTAKSLLVATGIENVRIRLLGISLSNFGELPAKPEKPDQSGQLKMF